MKQKQIRRLMKAKKKLDRLTNESLSDREIMDTFAYMLKTYESCNGAVKSAMGTSEKKVEESDKK